RKQFALRAKEVGLTAPLMAKFNHYYPTVFDWVLQQQAPKGFKKAFLDMLIRETEGYAEQGSKRLREREDYLQAIGFDVPSEKQRRENLAVNVALKDWPRIP